MTALPDLPKLRCLIIDDNASFLGAARTLLEREGILVVGEASTGAEALELAADLRPDVTLVDIDLGGESGFDLAESLAGDPGRFSTSVILVSTHAERDFADLIADRPADGFLAKSELSAAGVYEILSR